MLFRWHRSYTLANEVRRVLTSIVLCFIITDYAFYHKNVIVLHDSQNKQWLFLQTALSSSIYLHYLIMPSFAKTTQQQRQMNHEYGKLGNVTDGGENWSTHRETCFGTTLSNTNPTLSRLGLKQCLRCERPVTDCVRHGMTKQLVFIRTTKCVFVQHLWSQVNVSIEWIDTGLLIHHSFSGRSASRWWLIASKLWELASKKDYRNWGPLVTGTISQTK